MEILRSMNTLMLVQIPYIFAITSFLIQRTHFLIRLLCLEGIILSLVLLVPISLRFASINISAIYVLVILTIGACEARLGLSLIVIISGNTGSDILISTSINKC